MRIVISEEPINEYICVDRLECEYIDLPKMRAALFSLSLQLDDMIQAKERPDTWIAKETTKLVDETLTKHYDIYEEVKS